MINFKDKYHQRNTYNIKLAKIELSSLYHHKITTDDVLDHQSPYRIASTNIVKGSQVASYQNKEWLKKIMPLFTNRTVSRYLYKYYIVIKPQNSFLNMGNNPRFTTVSGLNPVKQNELTYKDIKNKIKKFNRRIHTGNWLILEQHQEHSQAKNLTDNNHDNYMILTDKPVDKTKMAQAFNREYASFNQISEGDVTSHVDELSSNEDLEKALKYAKENSSSLPYCKHGWKGQSQVDKLQNLPDTKANPIRSQYLKGLLNTIRPNNSKKPIQQGHRVQPRALNTYLNKVQHIHNQQARKPAPKPNEPKNNPDWNIIQHNTVEDNKSLLKLNKILLKNQLRQNVNQKFVTHTQNIINLLERKLGLNKTASSNYTISSHKQIEQRIKELIPNKICEAKFFGLRAYKLLKVEQQQQELEKYQIEQRIKQLAPIKRYEHNVKGIKWAFWIIKKIDYGFSHQINRRLRKIIKSNIIIHIQPIKKVVIPSLLYHTSTGIPPP